jgi:hypothetical protein
MTRKIDIILAAPGDAESATGVVEAVVDQLNLGAAHKAGVRFDLTHLNDGALPDSRDGGAAIFITALWTSYAKTSLDAARAARVRFLAAYDKYRADPTTVRILPFFNDELIAPSRIDPDQFAMIREYRDKVKADGLRAYSYEGREDLRTLIEAKLEGIISDLPPLAKPVPKHDDETAAADVVRMAARAKKAMVEDTTLGQSLQPPQLDSAANDDRFVLAAMTPITPELLAEIDRKAWEMVEAFDVISDIVSYMASDAKRHVQSHKPVEDVDPEMSLIFKMMSHKEEDDLATFAESAERRIGMLREIYQTVLNAMRLEYHRRLAEFEASGFDEDSLDDAFRAIAKFSGPLKAAAPHLQAFRARVSALRRTTAEFHKAKLQAIEFLDRYLADLAALRATLARMPAAEASARH